MRTALLALICIATPAVAETPQAAVDGLLAADRSFAKADADTVTALAAMFDADVVMPLPDAKFARGKAAVVEALKANPLNATSRPTWAPVRGGVSGDGRHGFTVGFMTIRDEGKAEPRLAKYLAYWVKRAEGWRVAAYKRAPRAGAVDTVLMAPALPARIRPAEASPSAVAGLIAAEKAFSDEAQVIGIGPAFRKHGSADATNFGNGPGLTVGADAIGAAQGSDATSPVTWSADDAIVAASGDLGVTWGVIRSKNTPAAFSFFTIWRRPDAKSPWKYVAE